MKNSTECTVCDDTAACAPSDVIVSEQLKMRRFLCWMQTQGATFPSMSIKVEQGSRQVHATRPLRAGDLVAHIPHTLTITPQRARESETGQLIAKHGSNIDDYDYLAAYLLQLRRDGGFWQPYIDVLPKDYSTNLLFYSRDELDELKGSYHLNAILSRIARHEYKYDQLPPGLKLNGFTREAFTWAKCVVVTRIHGTTRDGQPILAMVPLSDMFNHATRNNTDWSAEAQGDYFIRAEQPIEAGAPLFENYGRCNAQLLDEYGFCLEDNPNNLAEIRLQPVAPDHPLVRLTKKLGQQQWSKRIFRVAGSYDSDGAKAMFSYLRLACLGETPHAHASLMDTDQVGKVPPINRSNEVAALQVLAEACENRLRQFPTSLEEDHARLRDGGLSPNLRNVVMVRRDEKSILTYFLELAKTALPILHHAPCDAGRYATAAMPYAEYFSHLTQHL